MRCLYISVSACRFGDRVDCVSDFEVEMVQVCSLGCIQFFTRTPHMSKDRLHQTIMKHTLTPRITETYTDPSYYSVKSKAFILPRTCTATTLRIRTVEVIMRYSGILSSY
jgi:hypothetical protein